MQDNDNTPHLTLSQGMWRLFGVGVWIRGGLVDNDFDFDVTSQGTKSTLIVQQGVKSGLMA